MRLGRSILFFVGFALAACGGPGPCKDCLNVGGRYTEVSAGAGVNCGGGRLLYWGGGEEGQFTLEQNGSDLTLKGYFDVKGVLKEDGSVEFGPYPSIATVSGGKNGTDEPGKVLVSGKFVNGAPISFDGAYAFTAFIDSCVINRPTKWTKVAQ
jgi:hypothetical protein